MNNKNQRIKQMNVTDNPDINFHLEILINLNIILSENSPSRCFAASN